MSRRLILLGVAAIAVGAAVVATWPAPPPWEFVSAEHKFRVRFGSQPDVTASAGGLTKTSAYSVEGAAGERAVVVTDLPIPDDDPPERRSLYLDSARDDLIRAADGKRVSSTSIALAGQYPGREFTATIQRPRPGVMRARIYLVGKRLYQVMVRGAEGYANGPAATAFLDSFMVTE